MMFTILRKLAGCGFGVGFLFCFVFWSVFYTCFETLQLEAKFSGDTQVMVPGSDSLSWVI